MREHKYRAWHKTKHKMMLFELSELNDSMITKADDGWYLEDCELMEWTGIADHHGKDIYEGDILGLDDPEDASKAVVVFHNAALKAQLVISGIIVYSTDWDGWVVIGNKFEHPHLLEQSEGKQ